MIRATRRIVRVYDVDTVLVANARDAPIRIVFSDGPLPSNFYQEIVLSEVEARRLARRLLTLGYGPKKAGSK